MIIQIRQPPIQKISDNAKEWNLPILLSTHPANTELIKAPILVIEFAKPINIEISSALHPKTEGSIDHIVFKIVIY